MRGGLLAGEGTDGEGGGESETADGKDREVAVADEDDGETATSPNVGRRVGGPECHPVVAKKCQSWNISLRRLGLFSKADFGGSMFGTIQSARVT